MSQQDTIAQLAREQLPGTLATIARLRAALQQIADIELLGYPVEAFYAAQDIARTALTQGE